MLTFNLPGYVAKETAIGIIINILVSTVPSFVLLDPPNPVPQPIRDIAVDLTPQFFMAAFMSALVPSLLVWGRAIKGYFGVLPRLRRQRLHHIVAIAAGLAMISTILVLGLIHIGASWLGMTSIGPVGVLGSGPNSGIPKPAGL